MPKKWDIFILKKRDKPQVLRGDFKLLGKLIGLTGTMQLVVFNSIVLKATKHQ